MKTQLKNSYIKHFDFSDNEYIEGYDNHFTGWMDEKGTCVATFINSHGALSTLQGTVYRFLGLRLLIGRATGYAKYPNGAPYINFGFKTRKYIRGILLQQRGFIYTRLERHKS